MSPITVVASDETFANIVLQSKKPVLVDFWAGWCGPCLQLALVLEDLAAKHADKIVIVKIDIDQNPESAATFNVLSLPTLIVFRDGTQVHRLGGRQSRESLELIVVTHGETDVESD